MSIVHRLAAIVVPGRGALPPPFPTHSTGGKAAIDAEAELGILRQMDQPTPLDYLSRKLADHEPDRTQVVLLCSGSFSPIHRGHFLMLDLAARFLTTEHNLDVLAGFISPAVDRHVEFKLGGESIPFSHRYQMCKLACADHNEQPESLHVITDPWEGLMDSHASRRVSPQIRLDALFRQEFPGRKLVVLDAFGFDSVIHHHPLSHNVVAVGRRGYGCDRQTRPVIHSYVCPSETNASSTELRRRWRCNESFSDMTFPSVESYLRTFVWRPAVQFGRDLL
jgi:nicotinic acid mononucleotide adenylyltransferase